MTGKSRDRLFAPNGLLGDGRWFALTIMLPVLCVLPWLLATRGKPPWGQEGGLFAEVTIAVIKYPFKGAPLVQEAANRLQSASLNMLLVFTALVISLFALTRTWTTARNASDRVVLYVAGAIVIAILFVFLRSSPDSPRAYELLGNAPDGRNLFEATLKMVGDGLPLAMLNDQLDRANAAVVLAAVALALCASSIGIAAHRLSGKADLPTLNRLGQQLDLILLLAAVVLGIGVIGIKQWHAWPLPFIDGDKDIAAYSALSAAYLAFQSTCYVGVLTFIYLPAALKLQSRRGQIDPKPVDTDWAQANPAFLSLFRIVAMLSPVLVGPLASMAALKLPA